MVKGIAGNPSEVGSMPVVAILDDDPAFREALAVGVSTFGWCAVEAGTAEELFTLLAETTPACLILDYDLPGLDGLEVQARLLRDGYKVSTVFLSACEDERVVRGALASGAVAFLKKPVRLTQLEPVMQMAVSSARPTVD